MKNFVMSMLAICLGISIWFNVQHKVNVNANVIDTVCMTKIDTIVNNVPQLRIERLTEQIRDTLRLVEIIRCDSDTNAVVEIPISQKEYSDDSTYTAWVSGYKASLDSINVYNRTITKTIRIKNNDRWSLGVGTGIGYDGKRIRPYVGIGVTYSLFKW